MKKVTILPISGASGDDAYCAAAEGKQSIGKTAGEALDSLSRQFPDNETESLVVVQRMRPDSLFNADQQRQLADLMSRWRAARDQGQPLSEDEQTRLKALIEAELRASERRTTAMVEKLNR